MARRRLISLITLAVAVVALTAAATPTTVYRSYTLTPPAVGRPFLLPLADDTQATAGILQAPDRKLYMVYATPTGELALYHLGPIADIEPDPTPPTPPTPDGFQIAIIENPAKSTAAQRKVMSDKTWRDQVKPPNTFTGILPFGYVDPTTNTVPANLKPFFDAATNQPLPLVVLLDTNGQLFAVQPLPATTAGMLDLLKLKRSKPSGTPPDQRRKLSVPQKRTLSPNQSRPSCKGCRLPPQNKPLWLHPWYRTGNRLHRADSPIPVARAHRRRPGHLAA